MSVNGCHDDYNYKEANDDDDDDGSGGGDSEVEDPGREVLPHWQPHDALSRKRRKRHLRCVWKRTTKSSMNQYDQTGDMVPKHSTAYIAAPTSSRTHYLTSLSLCHTLQMLLSTPAAGSERSLFMHNSYRLIGVSSTRLCLSLPP
jgi:hypothetical protein